MKKASKILTLILIVVFVLSVFAGCDLVGKDVAKYRGTVAMKIGEQDVTIGKLLDTFNSYYNNYYYYISAGYLTSDSLLEMVINSVMQQYMQVDDYINHHNAVSAANGIKNAEYLTAEQFEYCIKYVKHTSYTTFDGTVITTLSVKHDIADAKDEDTSRNFTEYDELLSETSYAEHVLLQNFVSKDANEYFDKYYSKSNVDFKSFSDLLGDYVYQSQEEAQAILDELNDRLEDDSDEITFAEYQEAQQKAVDQYADTIKNNYGMSLQEFIEGQLADMVTSCILALWSYDSYKDIDVATAVKDADNILSSSQSARFAISKNFDSFITGLTDTSYIYSVPQDMQGKYVFVKNILIPFTDKQSAWLSAQADSYGGTSTDAYKNLRDEEAEKILAQYFDSDKYDNKAFDDLFANYLVEDKDEDAESKYEKIENIFKIVDNKLIVNPEGALGQFFGANGVVNSASGLSKSETIVELMKRFNTDAGQHSTRYDYVVYVGDDWKDYKHSWVEEFYTAVNELGHDESTGKFLADNIGKYAMCVSTYGVHIIYVEDFVESQVYNYSEIDWTNASSWNDTSTLAYSRYKAEFDNQVSIVTQKAFNELKANYIDKNLVVVNKQFKRFIKSNGFTFNFDEYIEGLKEEL
ncbi:MAG: hypothetical protein J1G02_06175 [Clostridiales bacterium]|nr:hypothetical protein [Clostridiales bacterium]